MVMPLPCLFVIDRFPCDSNTRWRLIHPVLNQEAGSWLADGGQTILVCAFAPPQADVPDAADSLEDVPVELLPSEVFEPQADNRAGTTSATASANNWIFDVCMNFSRRIWVIDMPDDVIRSTE
jgi:hypothetical protein